MSENKIIKTIQLDLAGYRFKANGQVYEIESGNLRTETLDNNSVRWDWTINLNLRKADFIPFNKPTALLFEDASHFVDCRVLSREKRNGLTELRLVPWMKE